jgi:hypothetical protein
MGGGATDCAAFRSSASTFVRRGGAAARAARGGRAPRPRAPPPVQVPLREDGDEHSFEEMVLTDDDLLHLVEQSLGQSRYFGAAYLCVRHGSSLLFADRLRGPLVHRQRNQNGDMPAPAAAVSIRGKSDNWIPGCRTST